MVSSNPTWYVAAVYMRIDLRITYIGVPHCTTSDELYLGYSVPENSTVFANLWYRNTFLLKQC